MKKLIVLFPILFSLIPFAVLGQDFCKGNFNYDDNVDGSDAYIFKEHYGRNSYENPCPPDGPAPVPKTGQTEMYHLGDDGYWKRGVEYPWPRFVPAKPLAFVRDKLTGLNWFIGPVENLTWEEAVDFCAESPLGDWRLPNIKEMMSLWDYQYSNPALCDALGANHHTPGNPFTLPGTQYYWTSTTYEPDATRAWYYNSNYGSLGHQDKGITMNAWCVSDGHGSPPAPTRFTDNGDGTVTDTSTGLVWLKDAFCNVLNDNGNGYDWNSAMWAVAYLNDGECDLTDGSQEGDWRLPTAVEWNSFFCTQYEGPAVCNTDGTAQWQEGMPFTEVQGSQYYGECYYTSDYDGSCTDACPYFGDIYDTLNCTHLSFVWPVRDP